MILSAPVFVPATKDALLLKNMQGEENKVGEITGWKYKLVERSGVLLRELLTRSNPWDTNPCGRKNCLACPMAKKPLNCKRRSLMYESTCKECVDAKGEPTVKYVGETARSGSERWGNHMRDARNKASDSHIYNHWQTEHNGRETEFQFQIMKFFSSPLDRQVSEAVRIERTGAHKILNTKGVYNRSSLPKLVAVDSKEEETIGDTGKTIVETRGGGQEEYILTGRALEKSQRRQRRKDKGRDTLNWGRIQEWVAPPTESCEEEDEEEFCGWEQCIDLLLIMLEDKDPNTPHTQSLVGHSPIPTRREANSTTLLSPGKAPPPQLPPSSPTSEARSCPKAILGSSAGGQWLVGGGGGHMWENSCSYKHQ